MNPIIDLQARIDALDITRSFLVQAPAGSGKTELLTQRFLSLLSYVHYPEEIIAITFTKKAAFEMRSRIISSLENPKTEAAKKALIHSKKNNWNLCEHPNRLRILTLDAFSLYLAQQSPIRSKLGAQLNIAEDANILYKEAIQAILLDPPKDAVFLEAIKNVILYLDNNYSRLEELLINLLSKRDQWLPLLLNHSKKENIRHFLENELVYSNHLILKKQDEIPDFLKKEMLNLAEYALGNIENKSDFFTIFSEKYDKNFISSIKKTWEFISNIFLTSQDSLRKKADKNIGFPAPSQSKNKDEKKIYEEYKKRHQALIKEIEKNQGIVDWLIEIKKMPNLSYTESQWSMLASLLTLLPLTVAQLRLLFSEKNKIDYIENAQSALQALGEEDNPSDFSLKLDYKIQHILIDEFQDTSNSQFSLLKKLTMGWSQNDGRTLFLVGDPMQSIYRFRQAEVGLFLYAKQYGIGDIKLDFLSLSSNFRSTKNIINWINSTFSSLFPIKENMQKGEIKYSHAKAIENFNFNQTSNIECFTFLEKNETHEEKYIINKIQEIKKNNPHDSIAILIRSRDHLKTITPQLQYASIEYQAIEIEKLFHESSIYDLLSLTKACIHLSDRVAWLSCLRAPWCGLKLDDLWLISHEKKTKTIWEQLNNPDIINKLSDEGKKRINNFKNAISFAIEQRQRFPIREIIEKVWRSLNKNYLLYPQEKNNIDINIEYFFSALENISDEKGLIELENLEKKISQIFSSTLINKENPVKIMTIHKSKGLEFDHVFIPKLNKKTSPLDRSLLTWIEYPDDENINHLLIAPISEINLQDKTYDYIQKQQQKKFLLETIRVFYVAATRAKKCLYLTATIEDETQVENQNSLLGNIVKKHPFLFESFSSEEKENINHDQNLFLKKKKTLKRLKLINLNTSNQIKHLEPYSEEQNNIPKLEIVNSNLEAKLGTMIHFMIEKISYYGLNWWNKLSKTEVNEIIESLCLQYNLYHEKDTVFNKINSAIFNMKQDQKGQWLLKKQAFSFSEWPICFKEANNQWGKKIIDRIIQDENGVYWIIDYKTKDNQNSALALSHFIEIEARKYFSQLESYRKIVQDLFPSSKIRMALYFPLLPAWYAYPEIVNINEI